jgi:hypothetical protein
VGHFPPSPVRAASPILPPGVFHRVGGGRKRTPRCPSGRGESVLSAGSARQSAKAIPDRWCAQPGQSRHLGSRLWPSFRDARSARHRHRWRCARVLACPPAASTCENSLVKEVIWLRGACACRGAGLARAHSEIGQGRAERLSENPHGTAAVPDPGRAARADASDASGPRSPSTSTWTTRSARNGNGVLGQPPSGGFRGRTGPGCRACRGSLVLDDGLKPASLCASAWMRSVRTAEERRLEFRSYRSLRSRYSPPIRRHSGRRKDFGWPDTPLA